MGLVHGNCWPGAEEPGQKADLKGKGAAGEMARKVALAMGIAKRTLLGVKAPHAPFRRVDPLGRGGKQHDTMILPNSSALVKTPTIARPACRYG